MQEESSGKKSPTLCQFTPCRSSAAVRDGIESLQGLSDAEQEIHIEDAHWQYRTAYERFEMHGCPCDRDEALQHLHRMNAAILARSPAVQAQRHAELEQRITDGCDFFQSPYALALGQPVGRTALA